MNALPDETGTAEAPDATCAGCGTRFRQRTGPGRRRDYCDPACRRRAERRRARERSAAATAAPAPLSPGRQVAAALAYLQRTSGVTVEDAARQADLPAAAVARALSAGRPIPPPWPVVFMLATIFGGRAQELRLLWEHARGIRRAPGSPPGVAAGRLHDAIRGLYLAASGPAATGLAEAPALPVTRVKRILQGSHVPDWAATERLAVRLASAPEMLRPLWEDVHYALLAQGLSLPEGGLPRTRLPGPPPGP